MNNKNYTLWVQEYTWQGKQYKAGALVAEEKSVIESLDYKIMGDKIAELTGLTEKDTTFEDWYHGYVKNYEDDAQYFSANHDVLDPDSWTAYEVSTVADLYALGLIEEFNYTQLKKILSERFVKALNWCRSERRRNREFREYWSGFFHGGGYVLCVFPEGSGDYIYRDWGEKFQKKDITYAIESASQHKQPHTVLVSQDIYGRTRDGEYSDTEMVDWNEATATIEFYCSEGKFYMLKKN